MISPFHLRRAHLHPRALATAHSPLQSEDAVEERLLRRLALHDEHAAQHVEVEVVLGQGAHEPGLEERRPAFLEGQASSLVPLMEERWKVRQGRRRARGRKGRVR